MAITKKTIKNLTGGISQQPDANRHDNQCTNQVNFLSDPIKGLTKRSGTKVIKTLSVKGDGTTDDKDVTPYLDVYDDDSVDHSQTAKDLTSAIIPHPLTVQGSNEDKKALLTISKDGKMTCHDLETGAHIKIYSAVTGSGIEQTPLTLHSYMAKDDHSNYKGNKYAIRTVADTTFIVNKAATVGKMASVYHTTSLPRGLIFIKEGAYNAEYKVVMTDHEGDDRTITLKTSDGVSGSSPQDSKTDNIAFILSELMALPSGTEGSGTVTLAANFASLGTTWENRGLTENTAIVATVAGASFNVSKFENGGSSLIYQSGSVIAVNALAIDTSDDGLWEPPISITDSYGDTMSDSWGHSAESFAGLPLSCKHGYKLLIKGAPESAIDDYYVKFVGADSTNGGVQAGVWEECPFDESFVEDGHDERIFKQLDFATMPFKLVPTQVGGTGDFDQFMFASGQWSDYPRDCGDNVTNPFPSFVGGGITDLFYFKNRLGLCSGGTITLSEVDAPFNFFRTTVTQLLPSDRLAIESNVPGHVRLNYAVPFANQMIVFSDNNQYIINYGPEGLTPGATSLTSVGTYDCSPAVRPLALDNSIIFAQEKSGYVDVYEMYPTGQGSTSFEAQSIAEQVPTLIKGNPVDLAVSSLARTVMVRSDDDYSKIFVYKYYTKGRDRIQSAWQEYDMNTDTIKALVYDGIDCNMVVSRVDNSDFSPSTDWDEESIQIVRMALDNTDDTDYSLDEWHTDITTVGSYGQHLSGYTKITLDKNLDEVENYYTRGTNTLTCLNLASSSAQVETVINANGLFLKGDFTSSDNVVIGLPVSCEYEFSKQYLKTPDNNNKLMAIVDGRTTIKWCEVYLNNSEYMELEVSYPGAVDGDGDPQRATTSKTFSGNVLGALVIGDDASETGKLRSVVAARNNLPVIKLKSNTHKKATITGCSFEIMLTSRLRGVR